MDWDEILGVSSYWVNLEMISEFINNKNHLQWDGAKLLLI